MAAVLVTVVIFFDLPTWLFLVEIIPHGVDIHYLGRVSMALNSSCLPVVLLL